MEQGPVSPTNPNGSAGARAFGSFSCWIYWQYDSGTRNPEPFPAGQRSSQPGDTMPKPLAPRATLSECPCHAADQASETIPDGKTLGPSVKLSDAPDPIFSECDAVAPPFNGNLDASQLFAPQLSGRSRRHWESAVAADIDPSGRHSPDTLSEQNMPGIRDRHPLWPEQVIRSEADSWQAIFDALPDALLLLDADEVVTGCNRAATAFFRRCENRMIGLPCRVVFQDSFGDEGGALFATIKNAQSASVKFSLAERWFRLTIKEIIKDGKKATRVWTISDITALRTMEEGLARAQQLEAAGVLAGGFAHEVNNLLMIIESNVALVLLDTPRNDPRCQLLRAAETASERACKVFLQLLGQYRPKKFDMKRTDLNACVREAVELLRGALGKDIQLETDCAEALHPVRADSGRLVQILLNLCFNARDAMFGRGTVFIETANETSGDYVRLRVRDTGPGIPPEVLPHIFEPFFTTREAGKGTGLGLTVVQRFVQDHHGWIECRSPRGAGACFDIYLPRNLGSGEPTPRDK
jgi:signal transduction histidine kinase